MSQLSNRTRSPFNAWGRRGHAGARRRSWVVALTRLGFQTIGRLAPQRMGRWAFDLWSRTRRYPLPEAEIRQLQQAQFLTLYPRECPVAVNVWGQGPSVLLVHGWNGRGTQLFSFISPLVRAGYRVIAFDAPGHGRTPGRRSDIFEISEAIHAVANEFGPLHGVIAHSFGVLCLAAARHQGLQVGRVFGISPLAGFDSLLGKFVSALRLPEGVRAVLRERLSRYVGSDLWRLLATDCGPMPAVERALIVHDEDDKEIPWQEGKAVAEAWPGAEFILSRGLGHRRILKDAGVVALARQFMQQDALAQRYPAGFAEPGNDRISSS